MSITAKPYTFTNNTVASGSEVNANFDAIFNNYNGNITDDNIAASGITTYGKVNASAIYSLGSLDAGAGQIPAANVATLNQNTTGTASNVTGVVAIANGGTGQTTAINAINALLPSQTGNNGKVLKTDGSVASWGDFESVYTASTTVPIASNETSVSLLTNPTDYTKKKSIVLRGSGTLTIKFGLYPNSSTRTAYGKIYRNGSPVGTEQSYTGTSYAYFTETIAGWSNGDTIELWLKTGTNANAYNDILVIYGNSMTEAVY